MNIKTISQEINWDSLLSGKRRIPNPDILEKYGVKNYCLEPYALELYEKMILGKEIYSKEIEVGLIKKIVSILSIRNNEMYVLLEGFIDAVVDLKREKNYLLAVGKDLPSFIDYLNTEEGKTQFLSTNVYSIVDQIDPYVKVSISKGVVENFKKELFNEIKNPKSAYLAKIVEKNGGGFIIDVGYIKGFLPGSLAAVNLVKNFDDMIGKEIPVVAEDYLQGSNTFVFSHKKYVNMILPEKLSELDLDKEYTGEVTGVTKFGIFLEFDDIFTGLLHLTKMSENTKNDFTNKKFTPGDKLSFWIKEISDKKIILTEENPIIKKLEIKDFQERNLGKITTGEVISIQPFGALVKLEKTYQGLISQKELKAKKKNYSIGESVLVSVDKIQNHKIFLSIPNES